MSADPAVIQLQQVLPSLGPVAIPVMAAVGAVGLAVTIRNILVEWPRRTANEKRGGLVDIGDNVRFACGQPAAIAVLEAEGWDPQYVSNTTSAATAAEIIILDTPTYLPTFATADQAIEFWSTNYGYYLQGLQTDAYFNAIQNWVNTEIARLTTTAPPPTIPPTIPPGTVITPRWSAGQLLQMPDSLVYTITAVEIVDSAPFYTLTRSDTGATVRLPEGVLVGAGAIPITAGAGAGFIPASTIAIPGFGTASVSVSVMGVPITGVVPAPPVAVPTTQTIVVPAPEVTILPTTVNVAAPPAPSVWVNPSLSTAGLEASLLTLPLVMSQSLVSALAGSAGNISHQAALGRNTCYGSTTAALLGNMLPTALGIFSMRALQSDVGIGGWVKDRATEWIDGHIDPRQYQHVETIDDLVANASKRLREAMSFGLQAHMWAVMSESNFVLKNLGLGQVAGFMADMADFKRVAQATIGAVEQAALSTPAKLLANYQLRPNIPGLGDLEEMYAKKEIPLTAPAGQPSLSHALALSGFSDDWIKIFSEYLWKDPRLGEIIRIGQFFTPELVPALARPDARTAEWLRNAGVAPQYIDSSDWYYAWRAAKGGYDPRDVSILVETAKRATARREQTLFLDGVTRMSRDGYITVERSRELILEAWEFSNPIAARLRAIELQKDYKLLSETRSVIVMAMSRGLITREEARTQLSELGFDSQRVELEVLKATLGLIPGVRLEISRPEEVLEEAGMEAE